MTAKDFRLIAQIISQVENPVHRHRAAVALANGLALTHPRFNERKFLAACGVPLDEPERDDA